MEEIDIEEINQYRFDTDEARRMCPYLEIMDNLTQAQLHRFVYSFYIFIVRGGIPEDYDDDGETWRTIWNNLFHQHMRFVDMLKSNVQRKNEIHYEEIIAQKDAEIARLLDIKDQTNPANSLDGFIDRYTQKHPNHSVRKFRVSYNKSDAPIRGFEIHFGGQDNRAITSPQNGNLGGRPRSNNPSASALYHRTRRDKLKGNPPDACEEVVQATRTV